VSAGIVPDRAASLLRPRAKLVGVFVNEMPQTVVTHAYNYRLDYIQLHGNETPTYIDNLKRTLISDILPDVKIIKAISIREADDVKRWRQYEGHIDLLLFDTKCKTVGGSGEQFDWSVLSTYDGDIPFLLSGGIGPQDAESIRQFKHPMFAGIDVNSKFEDAPAHKDIDKLQNFISCITQ
jgi:phosphoribosylanthranilate isomerase